MWHEKHKTIRQIFVQLYIKVRIRTHIETHTSLFTIYTVVQCALCIVQCTLEAPMYWHRHIKYPDNDNHRILDDLSRPTKQYGSIFIVFVVVRIEIYKSFSIILVSLGGAAATAADFVMLLCVVAIVAMLLPCIRSNKYFRHSSTVSTKLQIRQSCITFYGGGRIWSRSFVHSATQNVAIRNETKRKIELKTLVIVYLFFFWFSVSPSHSYPCSCTVYTAQCISTLCTCEAHMKIKWKLYQHTHVRSNTRKPIKTIKRKRCE